MIEKFEMEDLIPLVAELADKYTSKESSSIPYDIAKQLMGAIIYCINENSTINGELINNSIMNTNMNQVAKVAYSNGYKLVTEKVIKAKMIYEDIIKDFYSYENVFYYDTIIEGMPAFFINYDSKFNPQNHILTLDYPIIKNTNNLCGINLIYKYLSYIRLEQMFLKNLPCDYVTRILLSYHSNYKELLINICGIVLRNILGNIIVKKNILNIGFKDRDYELIEKWVSNNTRKELEMKLSDLIQLIVIKVYGNNRLLFEYFKEEINELSFELISGVENNYLDAIFLR